MERKVDVAIIGGGPAGLAAALKAAERGAQVLVLERDREPGGILQQCIHNGFGLHYFGEELTGPEYAARFVRKVRENPNIEIICDAMVLEFTEDRRILAVSAAQGLISVAAGAVVLAMGCRERTRGALNIPGSRPAGVYTAGCAQRLVNMEGYLPGREVVILGSGDIGLIMARRMTWEGAKVKLVAELMPYSSGLTRNIVQCLQDNDIPLRFNHTVVQIHGRERVTAVTVAEVNPETRGHGRNHSLRYAAAVRGAAAGKRVDPPGGRADGRRHRRRGGGREPSDQPARRVCLRQCAACARPGRQRQP